MNDFPVMFGAFLTMGGDYYLHPSDTGYEVVVTTYEKHNFFKQPLTKVVVDSVVDEQYVCLSDRTCYPQGSG